MYSTVPVQRFMTAAEVRANAEAVRKRRMMVFFAAPKVELPKVLPFPEAPIAPSAPSISALKIDYQRTVDVSHIAVNFGDYPPKIIPTIRDIIKAVAHAFEVKPTDILSHRRTKDVIAPRQITFALAKTLTRNSLPKIGMAVGGKDHTTVLHGIRKFQWLLDRLHSELQVESPVELWASRAKFHFDNP